MPHKGLFGFQFDTRDEIPDHVGLLKFGGLLGYIRNHELSFNHYNKYLYKLFYGRDRVKQTLLRAKCRGK